MTKTYVILVIVVRCIRLQFINICVLFYAAFLFLKTMGNFKKNVKK